MHAKRPLFCNIAPRVRELCDQRISAWRGSGIIELNIYAFIGRLHNTDRKFVSHSSYCEKKIQFLLRLVRIEINICLTLETLHCNPPLWPIFVLISSMCTRNGTSSFLGKWVPLYQSVFGRSPADQKARGLFPSVRKPYSKSFTNVWYPNLKTQTYFLLSFVSAKIFSFVTFRRRETTARSTSVLAVYCYSNVHVFCLWLILCTLFLDEYYAWTAN